MRHRFLRVNAQAYRPVRKLGLCFAYSEQWTGTPMKTLLAALLLASLAACGVETATTAASVAEMKRREMEQAKKDMDMAKQKIEAATQQVQKSAEKNDDASKD
jgi:hypothetical protein